MLENYAFLLFLVFWLLPSGIVLWFLRRENRRTHARLNDMERTLKQGMERMEIEFAGLKLTHFGLFRVKGPVGKSDWHWTVAQIEDSPADGGH